MKRRIWLFLLLGATALLQLAISLRQGLWADEIFSLAMATGHSVEHSPAIAKPELGDFVEADRPVPAAELRRYVEFENPHPGISRVLRAVKLSDTSPPLYYLVLHLWTRVFGTSDLALRSLSIVFSLACLPLIIVLARALESERAGWFAAVLFALAPLSLYYSTEGRMYSLLWLCVLLAAIATIRLHRGIGGWGWHVGWVAAAVAGMMVHYYFVFPLVAFGGFLLVRSGCDRRGSLILRTVAVIALLLPWYWDFKDVLTQWRITQHWVEWRPENYRPLIVLRDLLIQYFSGNGHYLWDPHRFAEIVALLVFLLVGLVAWRKRHGQPQGSVNLLLWLWFFAACLGPLAADLARHTYIAEYPRYSSTALPAACLLGGIGLGRLRQRSAWVALIIIVTAWAPNGVAVLRNRGRSYEPTRDAARQISVYGRADDLVLIHSIPTGAISLARYTTTPAAFATWIGQLGQRKVPDSLTVLLKGRGRVLFVKLHTVGEPAPEELWLRENATLVKEQQIAGVFISEFKPRGAATF